MLTRRSFLKTTLATSAVVATTGATAAVALQSALIDTAEVPVLIFADGSYGQTSEFSAALSIDSNAASKLTPPSYIDKDVLEQLNEVEAFCQTTPQGVLMGLTRDSDFFILEHTAAQHGFRLHYKGVHDFRDEAMRHEITAPDTLAPALAETLAQAKHTWPQQLARVVPEIIEAQGQAGNAEALAALNYRNDEPGYLVSWILKAV